MSRLKASVAAALLCVVVSQSAFAQTSTVTVPGLDVQNFWPSGGPSQAIVLQSSDVQPHLGLGFALVGNYMSRPLVFQQNGTMGTHDAVNYAFTTDFLWTLGLFDRVQLGFAAPLVVSQSGDGQTQLVPNGGVATQLPMMALRDFRFDASVAIIQRARLTNADGFGLRLNLGGAIPVGDKTSFEAAQGWTFIPTIIADFRFRGFAITANVGGRIRDTTHLAGIAWGSQLVLGVGVAYRPTMFNRLMIGVDYQALVPLYGTVNAIDSLTGVATDYKTLVPMEIFYGARFALDRAHDIEVTLGGASPLDQVATNPSYRLMGGLSYAPHGYDNDSDGVPDASDDCPNVPEDRDGFQDGDGCPDPDNDGDRIPDAIDHCPNAPEDVDNFQDDDGCPDLDNDGDGVVDSEDECATEAPGDHPDPAHPGCPIRDRDHDGVVDVRDRCPEDPQGVLPDPMRPGCPLPDRDHDGVGDGEDQCPSDPEGTVPDRFRPGCPDPDRDHDGIANEIDRCPDAPETINGINDDDGCADAGDEATSWAGNAIIFQNVIRLRPGIRRISAADTSVLVQAAQRLRGRGAGVARIIIQVVPAAGPAGVTAATRLATLVADIFAAHGLPRPMMDIGAAQSAAGATAGEVRVRVLPRSPAVRSSSAPSSSGSPASAMRSSSPPSSVSPRPASPAPSGSPAPAQSSGAPVID